MLGRAVRIVIVVIFSAAVAFGAFAQSTAVLLREIDREILKHEAVRSRSVRQIDSIKRLLHDTPADYRLMEELGQAYAAIDNDSAITVYMRGCKAAMSMGDSRMADRFRMLLVAQLPAGGFPGRAEEVYASVDTSGLDTDMMILYYDSGRRMYDDIARFHSRLPDVSKHYERLRNEAQRSLLDYLDPGETEYKINAAEAYYRSGELSLASTLLSELTDSLSYDDPLYGRAARMQADLARRQTDREKSLNYLARAALSELLSGSGEVYGLYDLGLQLSESGDGPRGEKYIAESFGQALASNSQLRLLRTANELPQIERTLREHVHSAGRMRVWMIAAMVILGGLLCAGALLYRRKCAQCAELKRVNAADREARDICLEQFAILCTEHMEKLNEFSRIATRKISTGKTDELLQLTQSGKFVELQAREFYAVFDNAFMTACPGFVDRLNQLLRPDSQIVLSDARTLTPELRIMALIRTGIDESARIAVLLNYAVNTIYTYRNKMKNRALDRDAFEDAVRNL